MLALLERLAQAQLLQVDDDVLRELSR